MITDQKIGTKSIVAGDALGDMMKKGGKP
jgi:hypothetical protein